MKLKILIAQLNKYFSVNNVKDNWNWMFDELFIKKSLKSFRRPLYNTGLVIQNSDEVKKIYTAFAPSTYILKQIKKREIKDCLLVVKHPFDWNGQESGFMYLSEQDYALMEEMKISLYSLHMPLDKNRNDNVVSTAYGFAKVVGLNVEEEFAPEGELNPELMLGLIGTVKEKNFDMLVNRLSKQLRYKVKTMKVSNTVGRVAIVTGGGFVPRIVSEAKEKGVTTYITGIITPTKSWYDKKNYPKSQREIEKERLNIVGCSHYLTEKWAMSFSIPYFKQFGDVEFIEDKEALKRLE